MSVLSVWEGYLIVGVYVDRHVETTLFEVEM